MVKLKLVLMVKVVLIVKRFQTSFPKLITINMFRPFMSQHQIKITSFNI